jgi:kojibiose phosphorylase
VKKDLWFIHTSEYPGDDDKTMRLGTKYQLSNGYMGYRGTLDEFRSEQKVGITLAGIFDQVGQAWREPVNAPNGGFTRIVMDGIMIPDMNTRVITHEQGISIRDGVFERDTAFMVGTKTLNIRSKRWLSLETPNLICIQYKFTCSEDADIELQTGIDYAIWDLNGPHLENFKAQREHGCLIVSAVCQESGKKITVAERSEFTAGNEMYDTEDGLNLRNFHLGAVAGKEYILSKYIAVVKDGDPVKKPIKESALDIVTESSKRGYEHCFSDHKVLWEKRWEKADVIIEGDEEAQIALRYSIFQLLMVAPVIGSNNSIPARALSGQVYKGAIFWDTEMFMLPFFLHTHPDRALELLRYRIKTLDGARRKARSEGSGYQGAFYAWESQDTGDDACTYFNVGDPITKRELRTYFRDKQIHISGDVAMAIWRYFDFTGDDSLLRDGGIEVILECARFYYSYIYFSKARNRFEVLDVIGPDEYHERVHNNAFTNQIVKTTFEIACKAAHYIEFRYPSEYAALIAKLDIEMEIPKFLEAAELLYIPRPDKNTGIIEQFDTYFKLKDISVEELKTQLIHPNEYWGAGQGIAVPTQVIKQADVVLMLSYFRDLYSRGIKKANWDYYESRTEHGSSLSACAYALVATEIGKLEWAYEYFMKTATIDLVGKYKLYAGTIFIGGSHPAANGGAWMTAIYGFGGIKPDDQKIRIDPKLYKKWNSLRFKLVHRGCEYTIVITHKKVYVTADINNPAQGLFMVCGEEKVCEPGSSFVVNLK